MILLSPSGIDMADEQGGINAGVSAGSGGGMTVQIGYDGSILESYPCQLSGVSTFAGYWNG